MAWRTTEPEVRGIVDTDSKISIEPVIRTANLLTDRVSSQDSGSILSDALLVEIETYLAAHFYSLRDQLFAEQETGDAQAVYVGRTAMGLRGTSYGQAAIDLDLTGTLASLGKKKAGMAWLGFPPSEQTDYVDRD